MLTQDHLHEIKIRDEMARRIGSDNEPDFNQIDRTDLLAHVDAVHAKLQIAVKALDAIVKHQSIISPGLLAPMSTVCYIATAALKEINANDH